MFRHIALFRWTDDATPAAVARITAELQACAAAVPAVRGYTCGPDLVAAQGLARVEDRYDYGVVADFDDLDGWAIYDADPEHSRVRAELIRPLLAGRIVVQLDL